MTVDHLGQHPSMESCAERQGLSPYDLVILAAEECGLIPTEEDERMLMADDAAFERRMDQ